MNKELINIFIIGIGMVCIIVFAMVKIAVYNYEIGYKDATKDFYEGNLKMERVEENVVEYKWVKNK